MKRYAIKSEKNTVASDWGVTTAELKVRQDDAGDWVKYDDVWDLIRAIRNCMYLTNEGTAHPSYLDHVDVLEMLRPEQAKALKEILS